MEEAKEAIKKSLKKAAKATRKVLMPVILVILLILIILAPALYFLTVDDGTYKEDDWSSTPYAAAEYTNGVSVNSDGTLSSNTTTQELWDKMIENKSRVNEYLDSPEELARLMKAEIVTQYPDTRPSNQLDTPIDWKKIFEEEPDTLQGIIKFKRSNSKGSTSNLAYVDPETFYEWIETYAETGSETAKNNALTHFTLDKNNATSSNTEDESQYTTSDIKTNYSEAIVNAAKQTGSPGAGLCQKWVRQVYGKAGLGNASYATAYQAFKNNCVSTKKDNIPIGAAVYGTGSGSSAGHVGIYIGNGQVMDNVGQIKTQSLTDWIAWQEAKPTVIPGEESGWLGWGWQAGSPKILGTEGTDINQENNNETIQQAEPKGTSYTAVVATWQQVDTTITTDDPNVKGDTKHQYTMNTTNINYEEMVDKYTMPFDLLWALLVVGENRNFIFELADLIYNSDIQITIHDNLTVNTDTDVEHSTQRTKAVVDATITAQCNGQTSSGSISNDEHDPDPNTPDKSYTTTTKVVTQTNTVDVALTKANVWIVDYENNYQNVQEKEKTTNSETINRDDEEYPKNPNSTGDSYSCEHITAKKQELEAAVKTLAEQADAATATETTTEGEEGESDTPVEYTATSTEAINVKYYQKRINISNEITNKVKTQKYTQGTPQVKEKTDETTEPNFVTIFNKYEYKKNKSNIKDVDDWLFEIIETNPSTADMLDLVKYLLYKATKTNYGVEEYDFGEYDASSFTGVTGIYGNTAQEKVWFALKAAGCSDYAAAAVMGNIQCESGFREDAIEKGSGIGFGLCQWSFGRRDAIEKYAKSKGANASNIDIQIEFLIAELTPGGGANRCASYQLGGISSAKYDGKRYKRKDWENATDLDTATIAFMALFERPSYDSNVNHIQQRREAAKKYYDQFQGKEAPSVYGTSIPSDIANSTGAQKLSYLFNGNPPTTENAIKPFLTTVDVAITQKNGIKTTKKLTIHKQLATDVQAVFQTAQDGGFRIYEATGYSYRKMNNGGSGKLSHHSYGVAIDINVNENYSHRGSTVYAGSFWNPGKSKYSIPKDGVLVKAFASKGWSWGGNWSGNYQDYMHFSFTGN